MLAEAVERFLGIPHIYKTLGVVDFFAVDFDGCERAGIFLG